VPAKRKYELKRRAENQATTRQRIVEAALQLHATVGPARTTVMDIAKGAGVERVTVYRHFPDDLALFSACSAHYRAQNPPPETSSWGAIDDPIERLRVALRALYAYYDQVSPMLQNVLRDAETVPAVWRATEPRRRYVADLRDLLASVTAMARQLESARHTSIRPTRCVPRNSPARRVIDSPKAWDWQRLSGTPCDDCETVG
jgi:AcrR family transcriptional regulator